MQGSWVLTQPPSFNMATLGHTLVGPSEIYRYTIKAILKLGKLCKPNSLSLPPSIGFNALVCFPFDVFPLIPTELKGKHLHSHTSALSQH